MALTPERIIDLVSRQETETAGFRSLMDADLDLLHLAPYQTQEAQVAGVGRAEGGFRS